MATFIELLYLILGLIERFVEPLVFISEMLAFLDRFDKFLIHIVKLLFKIVILFA